ncbi:hypothetical protein AMV212 [Betaentomopoxvirus amoorei]|uniref:AMV212 n=1 Tax=Amsacta moorei entomopoxvirus TaxID=28321 RepID=Q9EMJ4_AMEPV|nr:hypothetical protein AMV212 [Amsacta moorei entomopoxvirus]AAG02918.1 AMV212 [Amsacta moorei entomopoxvirus]
MDADILFLNNKKLYILTLSDIYVDNYILINSKLKYKFMEYNNGYVWSNIENINVRKIKQIINNRDYTGLNGTYVDGEIPRDNSNIKSIKIYNFYDNFVYNYEKSKILDEYYFNNINNLKCFDNNDECKKILYSNSNNKYDINRNIDIHKYEKDILSYNNIPIIFYINTKINLNINDLKLTNKIKIGKFYIFKVLIINNNTDIGRVVISPNLIDMMEEYAGIALFSDIKAFGNFNYYIDCYYDSDDEWSYPNHYPIIPPSIHGLKNIEKFIPYLKNISEHNIIRK